MSRAGSTLHISWTCRIQHTAGAFGEKLVSTLLAITYSISTALETYVKGVCWDDEVIKELAKRRDDIRAGHHCRNNHECTECCSYCSVKSHLCL